MPKHFSHFTDTLKFYGETGVVGFGLYAVSRVTDTVETTYIHVQ